MMLISPAAASLAFTGSSPTYLQSAWAAGTAYAKYAIRRYAPSGSTYYDYTCIRAHTSSSTVTPSNTWYWQKGGLSATTGGYTYTTNVRHSNYAAWTSGAAVPAWAPYYDVATHRDYLAPLAISAGDNTVRPSEAILSSDATIAARWVDAGAANAWAPYDSLTDSYLQGYGTSDQLLASTTFSFAAQLTAEPGSHVFLSGLSNVATASAVITATNTATGAAWGTTITQPATASLALPNYGVNRRSAILPFTTVPTGYTVTVAITLTQANSNAPAQCAVAGVGYGYELADTEWGVETSILDFSRRERDQTYGTVAFMRRGSAKVLRATCYMDPASVAGDVAQYILQDHTGRPLMLDFNNDGSDYDRLRVFGFYTNLRTVISAASYETLALDVEGLVE